jgi:hypothetical protein
MVLHNGRFELSLELRFKVYHELVMSCLNDNRGSDVGGLIFACRQIHQEMEDEVIVQARPVFKVMHDWKTLQPDLGSLELQFAEQGQLYRDYSCHGYDFPYDNLRRLWRKLRNLPANHQMLTLRVSPSMPYFENQPHSAEH